MAQAPDQIRNDIAQTRADLARDVDRLADRTMPNRVARRRWSSMRDRMRLVGEKVMGTAPTRSSVSAKAADTAGAVQGTAQRAGGWAGDAASRAGEVVQQTPTAVREQTQGNPLAAGVIAFGAGLLAASLLPRPETEAQLGERLREQAEGLVERVREPVAESVQQVRQEAADAVRHAAEQAKQTATDAARATAQQGTDAARDAAQQARKPG